MRDSYNCTILYYLAGRPSPSISEARCACVSMVRSPMPYVVLYANTGEQPRRINNEQECIYLCWPQSNASPSANDMSTKLYLNTLCRGFCTSVLFIAYMRKLPMVALLATVGRFVIYSVLIYMYDETSCPTSVVCSVNNDEEKLCSVMCVCTTVFM